MQIIIHILIAFLTCVFMGVGFTGYLAKWINFPVRALIAITGYAISQLIFVAIFLVTKDVKISVYFTLSIGGILNILYFYPFLTKKVSWNTCMLAKQNVGGILLLVCGCMVAIMMAGLPYFSVGWGNYWHSANEDVFDALNGRLVFSGSSLQLSKQKLIRTMFPSQTNAEYQLQYRINDSIEKLQKRYESPATIIQYSSMAFWSRLLNKPDGIDVFIIQMLVNLVLTLQGMYAFVKYYLNLSRAVSISIGLVAVISNLYLATYYAGHQGSLMYGAFMPFLYLLSLCWIESYQKNKAALIFLSLWMLCVLFTYPFPLGFWILPVVGYALLRWGWPKLKHKGYLTQRNIVLGVLVLVALILAGYFVLWYGFEPTRQKSMGQFRAAGTFFTILGIVQYLGIVATNISSYSPYLIHLIITNNWLIAIAILLSISIISGIIVSIIFCYKQKKFFFVVWYGCWVLFIIAMRWFVRDPYYFYKFLYLNQFMTIITLGFWVSSFSKQFKLAKVSFTLMLVLILSLNIENDIKANKLILSLPYNKYVNFSSELLSIPESIIRDASLEFSRQDITQVTVQILRDHNITYQFNIKKAKYLLLLKQDDDIFFSQYSHQAVVWESSLFKIVKKPRANFIQLKSYWQPEHELKKNLVSAPFRWISGGRNGVTTITMSSIDLTKKKYLHLCVMSGPGINYKSFSLYLRSKDYALIEKFVVYNRACYSIPLHKLAKYAQPWLLSSSVIGAPVGRIDSRQLNYRLSHVGLSNSVYNLDF